MRMRETALVALLMLAVPAAASATPILVGLGAFTGTETLINFNTIGNEVAVTNQYAGLGLTWSGSIYGMTNPGDISQFPSNGGGVIASNWRYSQNPNLTPMVGTFAAPATRVGFYHETNTGDALLVSVFRNNILTGSFTIANPNGTTADFFGVQDLDGIDRISIDAQNNENRFLAIDDFRFNAGPVGPAVPEPASLLLLGTGLGLGAWRKRRR
jgi:hypothetical protein